MAAWTRPGARLETFLRSGVGAVLQGKGRDGAVRRLRRPAQPCPGQPGLLGAAAAREPAGQGGSRPLLGPQGPPLSAPAGGRPGPTAAPFPLAEPTRGRGGAGQGRRGGLARGWGASCDAQGPGRRTRRFRERLRAVAGHEPAPLPAHRPPRPPRGSRAGAAGGGSAEPLPGGRGGGKVAESPAENLSQSLQDLTSSYVGKSFQLDFCKGKRLN